MLDKIQACINTQSNDLGVINSNLAYLYDKLFGPIPTNDSHIGGAEVPMGKVNQIQDTLYETNNTIDSIRERLGAIIEKLTGEESCGNTRSASIK